MTLGVDDNNTGFTHGALWDLVRRRTAEAVAAGALQSIGTEQTFVQQEGVRFVVRRVSSPAATQLVEQHDGIDGDQAPLDQPDPFLPHDPCLFVADISPTHMCLLNKYNVLEHHLLIVTRAFEPQDTLLGLADFAALWACLREGDAFGFYNGGTEAGASQPHRHLQVVSLPLANTGPAVPIAPLLQEAPLGHRVGRVPVFQFAHALTRMNLPAGQSVQRASRILHRVYCDLWRELGHDAPSGQAPDEGDGAVRQPQPHNLLVTRDWMLLVPRVCDSFSGISVNALGFAGALLVRDREQVQLVQKYGPMRLLEQVAIGI